MSVRVPPILQPFRFLPALVVMGVIFLVSHQPADQLHLPPFPHFDKVAHFCIYATLAFACEYGVLPWHGLKPRLHLNMGVVIFCCLYGISDEFHQTFVVGRDASIFDLLADTAGAAVAVAVHNWWRSRKTKHHGEEYANL